MLEETVSGFLLFLASALGAALTALWAGMAIWTWRDIRARSRDGLAHVTATALVALLNVIGLLVYLMLRPRETLAEAYERSLEEEALLHQSDPRHVAVLRHIGARLQQRHAAQLSDFDAELPIRE